MQVNVSRVMNMAVIAVYLLIVSVKDEKHSQQDKVTQ